MCSHFVAITLAQLRTVHVRSQGGGGVSHYSLFWGHIKDPALVSLGKKAIFAIPTYFLFMHLPCKAFKLGHPEMN